MKFEKKPSCSAQRELRKLYNTGVETRTWKSLQQCAELISIPRQTFVHHLKDASDESAIKKSLDAMHKVLDSAYSEAVQELRKVYREGIEQGAWSSADTCVKAVGGISSSKLGNHLRGECADDVVRVTTGMLRTVTLSKSDTVYPLAREPADRPVPLDISGWLEGLISGELAFEDQVSPDGVRFLINTETVREIPALLTEGELKDTEELMRLVSIGIDELIRRFALLNQDIEGDDRRGKWRRLMRHIDALYTTMQGLSKVSPSASAKLISEIEDGTARLRQLMEEPNHEE